jgi:arginine exporter protein ArgO
VYFAAVVLGLQLTEDLTPGDAFLFAAGAFLASLSWQTILAGMGATVRRQLPHRFGARAAIAGNVLVLGMAALIVLR